MTWHQHAGLSGAWRARGVTFFVCVIVGQCCRCGVETVTDASALSSGGGAAASALSGAGAAAAA